MSKKSNESGPWARRRNLFSLSALSPITAEDEKDGKARNTLKKPPTHSRKTSQGAYQVLGETSGSIESSPRTVSSVDVPSARRPANPSKTSSRRGPSMFDSLRALRLSSDGARSAVEDLEPLSAVSTTAPSISFPEGPSDGQLQARTVLCHGEVQTSAGVFRKKREYLVLTDTHLLRYKSQARASEIFKVIPNPALGRSGNSRHSAMPSISSQGSASDLQTVSDSSGDKHVRIPLRQVIAVHRSDDGRPYFSVEICCLDEEASQSSTMTLQFGNNEDRDRWLQSIRNATRSPRIRELASISDANVEYVARVVDRAYDYDPSSCTIFKVVPKHATARSLVRSASDEFTKSASAACFLAVGINKIHLIPLSKNSLSRASISPAFQTTSENTSQECDGILTLSGFQVSASDDTIELVFRRPLQKSKHVILASASSYDIAIHLFTAEILLRPQCVHQLMRFSVPNDLKELLRTPQIMEEEYGGLIRTLTAYCIAYDVNPANIRYTIDYECENAPCFELLSPADTRRQKYTTMELLAVLRSLRYNESFGSISLAGIPLDELNHVHERFGHEFTCTHTKRGTPIKLSTEQLTGASLLVQEIRALAATSKKLRRMDFSGCITTKSSQASLDETDESSRPSELGCGIAEALFPLCRQQTTNVDWISLNGIELSETDLDWLVGAAVDKSCHFRSIALNRCGLTDRSLGLVLDALRAHENTLEAIEIAGNTARINPISFDSQLSVFGFIRKLDLSNISRTSGTEPLLTAETLLIWRLQELRFSGTALNAATVNALATYVANSQSNFLRELYVDSTYLSGSDIAVLLRSLCEGRESCRELLLDISQNHLSKDVERVAKAITENLAPTHIIMRAIEYREESLFRKMLTALARNKSICHLDMSQTALPGDASEETCRALEHLMAENNTLQELDISGEDSRLATSMFGPGLNDALTGLKRNHTLRYLRVEKQRLGLQGASTLADVLKENSTLCDLHCGNNEIPLQGLTDLINSLIDNTTLIYLPTMDDGRAAAFRSAELTMKGMSEWDSAPSPPKIRLPTLTGSNAVKRGIASVRRTATRSASAYNPSFPALSSYDRSQAAVNTKTSAAKTQPPTRSRANTNSTVLSATFTVQDIQTTQRLLTEQWDRQCFRLEQYLHRNWCIANDMPANMEVEDEKFERPESAGSLSKMLEQVKYDTTPHAEKTIYFDSPQESAHQGGSSIDFNQSSLTLRTLDLDD